MTEKLSKRPVYPNPKYSDWSHDMQLTQYASDLNKYSEVLEGQLREWDEERVPRLSLVGELIRNDWSGTEFDGRDVRDWIDLILDGKYGEFDDEVKHITEDSFLYGEIIKRKEEKKSD